MTVDGSARKASALVVGIERYGFSQQGPNHGKEAHLAAEFAAWLRDNKVCPPNRITLITAYDEENYDNPVESPSSLLDELKRDYEGEPGVEVLDNARHEQFSHWARDRHPARDDELFVLFWTGQGLAGPEDPYEKVCLLTEDADEQLLRHVELKQLLHAAGTYAPSARRVAFVDASRGLVERTEERGLGESWQVPKGTGTPRAPEEFLVYAAAHEKTAGDHRPYRPDDDDDADDRSFTHVLLDYLDRFAGPQAIFGERREQEISFEKRLEQEVRRRWKDRQDASFWTIYRYRDRDTVDLCFPVPDDRHLTTSEWADLLTEVTRIDDGAPEPLAGKVLWYAYCYAAGLPPADGSRAMPEKLESLGDLMRGLRDLNPLPDALPPLVVATDFVANLSATGIQTGLLKWCNDWANARGGEGLARLKKAADKRPSHLPDRPYLSILIKPANPPDYQISAVLWTAEGPQALPGTGLSDVPEGEIGDSVEDLFGRIGLGKSRMNPHDMVVEFVLPRDLLGWPGAHKKICLNHPVVVRDLQRLLGQGIPKNSMDIAETRWLDIQRFAPFRRSTWVKKITWFDCKPQWPDPDRIEAAVEAAVSDEDVFCIGLAVPRRRARATRNAGREIPPFLDEAVDAGAPIVIWIQQEIDCDGEHGLPFPGSPINGCAIPRIKKRIAKGIRSSRQGLRDLPYLVHELRLEFSKDREGSLFSHLQIGLLMEDTSRFWPGYFNWQSPGGSPSPQGGG